jgi:hypothetical protein
MKDQAPDPLEYSASRQLFFLTRIVFVGGGGGGGGGFCPLQKLRGDTSAMKERKKERKKVCLLA